MLDVTRAYGLDFLFPRGDRAVGASLRTHGEFARPEVDLISAYLQIAPRPGTFIDVGANIGAIALPLAARHRDWRIMAFEANRNLCSVLAANTLNNQLYNVEPTHAAVSDRAGLAEFPGVPLDAEANFGMLGFGATGLATETVRLCTLDAVAPPDVGFVKIDVEGFEAEVLRGAAAVIGERKPVWLLEADKKNQPRVEETMGLLMDAGYRLFWFYAPFVTAKPLKGAPAPPVWRGDLNLLALPPGAPNLWNLNQHLAVDAPWPTEGREFGYLQRYGFDLPAS
jgi:FkbM family methyltransferase